MVGLKYGRLTVLSLSGHKRDRSNHRHITWLCLCECGAETIVLGMHLRSGNTTSCGCYHKESLIKRVTDSRRIQNWNILFVD